MQLGVRDVARILGVSEKTVYRWIRKGALPAYRVEDQYRIHRAELLEWVTERRIPVTEEVFSEPDPSAERLSLVAALEAGGIQYRVEGCDKESVLREVVRTMHLPEEVDREFLFRVLMARESLCSTAVGEGVAIPHPRNPIVFHISRPIVALSFLEHPVEFGAMDNEPVRVLFTLISPTVRGHLRLLSRLTYALRDASFRRAILEQGTRETILSEARRLDEALDRASGSEGPAE